MLLLSFPFLLELVKQLITLVNEYLFLNIIPYILHNSRELELDNVISNLRGGEPEYGIERNNSKFISGALQLNIQYN